AGDGAFVGLLQQVDALDQRALARAARPDDPEDFAGLDVQAEAAQRLLAAARRHVALVEVVDAYHVAAPARHAAMRTAVCRGAWARPSARARNADFSAAALDLQPFGRNDAQSLQPLDVAGTLHLHDPDLVAHDHGVVHRHAEHPDFVQDTGRVEVTSMLGGRPQAEHVAFPAEYRKLPQSAGDRPGRTTLVAPTGVQVPPGLALGQVDLDLVAGPGGRRYQ